MCARVVCRTIATKGLQSGDTEIEHSNDYYCYYYDYIHMKWHLAVATTTPTTLDAVRS